jgi:hypothetical protein
MMIKKFCFQLNHEQGDATVVCVMMGASAKNEGSSDGINAPWTINQKLYEAKLSSPL